MVMTFTTTTQATSGLGRTSPGTINGVAFSSVGLHVNKGTLGRTITEGSWGGEYIMNHSGESANRRAKFIQSNAGDINIGSYDDNGTQRLHARLDNNGTFFLGNTSTAYQTVFFDSTPGTVYGNGTLQISPLTSPGSGIAQFTTNFADRVGGGTTKHNVRVGGTVTATDFIGGSGAYLPLSAGSSYPLTGDLYLTSSIFTSTVKASLFTIKNSSPYIQWEDLSATRLAYIQHSTNLVINTDSGEIRLQTPASTNILLNPGTGGNVGIGTDSPDFKLDVDGTFGVSDLPFNSSSVSVLVADETIGAELITNGNFATDSDWTKQTSWSISGGSANYDFLSDSKYIRQTLLNGGFVANFRHSYLYKWWCSILFR